MESIGERLRGRRRERGLRLQDVEAATRIRLRYIQALEEDRVADLPAEVFTLGFLRAYAQFLELDATGMVNEFKRLHRSSGAARAAPVVAAPKPGRRDRRSRRRALVVEWLILAVIVLAIALLVWTHAHAHLPPAPARGAAVQLQSPPP